MIRISRLCKANVSGHEGRDLELPVDERESQIIPSDTDARFCMDR